MTEELLLMPVSGAEAGRTIGRLLDASIAMKQVRYELAVNVLNSVIVLTNYPQSFVRSRRTST